MYSWSSHAFQTSTKTGKVTSPVPASPSSFDQFESFWVAKGTVGTTHGWGAEDHIWTPEDAPFEIAPWVPHRFWPDPNAKGDGVVYLWAHPNGVPEPLDKLFFENLLIYISEVSEKKVSLSLLQIMTSQHASATALIMFPTAWWLGPLRWWVPWKFQAACAWIGSFFGYKALMENYTAKEDWEQFLKAKRA